MSGLPAGGPALIVLGVLTTLCTAGYAALRRRGSPVGTREGVVEVVVLQSCCASLVAGTFWGWAVLNVAERGFDLGIVSFLCVLLAAANGTLVRSGCGLARPRRRGALLAASALFVSINYAVGIVVVYGADPPVPYQVAYFGVASAGWLAFAWWAWAASAALAAAVGGAVTGDGLLLWYSSDGRAGYSWLAPE